MSETTGFVRRVIGWPGIYRTVAFDKKGRVEDLAHVECPSEKGWEGFIPTLTGIGLLWDRQGKPVDRVTHEDWHITGPYEQPGDKPLMECEKCGRQSRNSNPSCWDCKIPMRQVSPGTDIGQTTISRMRDFTAALESGDLSKFRITRLQREGDRLTLQEIPGDELFIEPFVKPLPIEQFVGYLKLTDDGAICKADGGTLVATANEIGWGERATQIAERIVGLWNADLQNTARQAATA